jgi:HK97 family phage portal protein
MRIFGLSIARARPAEKSLASVSQGGGWWNIVRESFPGAWQRNIAVSQTEVLSNPTVFSCVNRIATDIAKIRLRLVELSEAAGIWVETTSPAYSPVIRKPNHYQTRIEFIASWISSKLAFGNTYVLKERDARGIVVALYVLNPQRVKVLVSELGDVFYELSEDHINDLHQSSVTVPAREIIHDKMNTLFHPLVGLSPIYASGLAATQAQRIQNNSAQFFGNGARPSGVLSAPDEISQAAADRLKTYWESEFSGTNAGKVAVLGDGLHYEPMMMSSVDAQLIEQLQWTAETICGCFGVPAYLVGVGDAPLNNNAQTLREIYYSQCLQIHIEQIEALLDEGLGIKLPLGTEFDLDDLLRMDGVAMAEMVKTLVGAGVMKIDEARKKFALPPTEGGDTPYLQEQNFSLAAMAKRDAKPDPWAKAGDARPATPAPAAPDETERAIAAVRFKFAEALHVA